MAPSQTNKPKLIHLLLRIPTTLPFIQSLDYNHGTEVTSESTNPNEKFETPPYQWYQSHMVTIGMNYEVLPGKEPVFERAFNQVLEVMKQGEGHTHSVLYQAVGKPSSYLIISDWNDKNAFDKFIKSEAFAKVTSWGKEQILAGRPAHKVYSGE